MKKLKEYFLKKIFTNLENALFAKYYAFNKIDKNINVSKKAVDPVIYLKNGFSKH